MSIIFCTNSSLTTASVVVPKACANITDGIERLMPVEQLKVMSGKSIQDNFRRKHRFHPMNSFLDVITKHDVNCKIFKLTDGSFVNVDKNT